MMGGTGAHEYMAPCPAGEDDVALAPGYAANVEVASAEPAARRPAARRASTGELHTPGTTTIEAVAEHLGVPPGNLLKAFPIVTESRGAGAASCCAATTASTRSSSTNALGEEFRQAEPEELEAQGRGRLHRARATASRCSTTPRSRPGATSSAPTAPTYHVVIDVEAGERVDVRRVEEGDTVGGQAIRIEPAIEVGNIFKLGTRYSEPLGRDLPRRGRHGAADRHGLLRHRPRAHRRRRGRAVRRRAGDLVAAGDRAVGRPRRGARQGRTPPSAPAAEKLVRGARGGGPQRALRRPRRAGRARSSTDAELLGCPLRIVVGKRSLGVRRRSRRRRAAARSDLDPVPLEGAAERGGRAVAQASADLPAALGLTAPAATAARDAARRAAAPVDDPQRDRLRAARLPGGVPRRRPRRRRRRGLAAVRCSPSSPGATTLDGMAARITGQYSRLGALLDPVVDRALVVAAWSWPTTTSCCRAGR